MRAQAGAFLLTIAIVLPLLWAIEALT